MDSCNVLTRVNGDWPRVLCPFAKIWKSRVSASAQAWMPEGLLGSPFRAAQPGRDSVRQ